MAEETEPHTTYVGETLDEKIASSQMFMIGRAILMRYGQGMTEDERSFMNVALSQFVVIENEKQPKQAQRLQPAGEGQQQPGRTQTPSQQRK